MWSHNGLVDLQICRTATQALNIDTPLFSGEPKGFEGSRLTCQFDRINMLVTAIVACGRVAFGIFVAHWRPKGVENCTRGEVF
jgi:hypothetical protein